MAGSEPGSAVQLVQMDLGLLGHAAEGRRGGLLVRFAFWGLQQFLRAFILHNHTGFGL